MSDPEAGTTRYLCPLECGWHHDVPPPGLSSLTGITSDPGARNLSEAIASIATQACLRDAAQTETALREHLATHTTAQFVRVIRDLRAEVAQLKRAAEPAPW